MLELLSTLGDQDARVARKYEEKRKERRKRIDGLFATLMPGPCTSQSELRTACCSALPRRATLMILVYVRVRDNHVHFKLN